MRPWKKQRRKAILIMRTKIMQIRLSTLLFVLLVLFADRPLSAQLPTDETANSSGESIPATAPVLPAPAPVPVPTPAATTAAEPPKTDPNKLPTPTTPQLSEAEVEKLHEQLLKLDSLKGPGELFDYIRKTYQARNYRGAALGMAFGDTKYATQQLQQNCLALWSHIIERLDDRFPQDFPNYSKTLRHRFYTSNSYIDLDFVKAEPNSCWQLASTSIAQTDTLYQKLRDEPPIHGDWLSRHVPDWMFRTYLNLSLFKWTMLAFGFLMGVLNYWIIQGILRVLAGLYIHVANRDVRILSSKLWKQIAAIGMVFVWFQTFSAIVLDPTLYAIARGMFWIFTIVMSILVVMKLIDLLAEALRIRIATKYSDANVDNLIIPLVSRSMKGIAFCIGAASLAQAFNWPLVGVLSTMGIGGIAIAFAAKETVGNFFGSMTVLIDRPFEIGDWIVTDGVEGTVEAVGMRSTRIRTFYNSVITIPNNNLMTAVIDNMGRRRFRRFRTMLTLQYDNGPARVEAFCEGVKELILNNPFTHKENYFVCLYNLQPSSLDVLLNVFFICPSTDTENRERAKLLGNILRLAEEMDVRFAYPTQRMLVDNEVEAKFKPLDGNDPQKIGKEFAMKLLNPEQ